MAGSVVYGSKERRIGLSCCSMLAVQTMYGLGNHRVHEYNEKYLQGLA